jgi:hypothetical protein
MEAGKLPRPQNYAPEILLEGQPGTRAKHRMRMRGTIENHLGNGPES